MSSEPQSANAEHRRYDSDMDEQEQQRFESGVQARIARRSASSDTDQQKS